MTTISEFERLLESNISQLNMTVGEIIPATVIDIKNDFDVYDCSRDNFPNRHRHQK